MQWHDLHTPCPPLCSVGHTAVTIYVCLPQHHSVSIKPQLSAQICLSQSALSITLAFVLNSPQCSCLVNCAASVGWWSVWGGRQGATSVCQPGPFNQYTHIVPLSPSADIQSRHLSPVLLPWPVWPHGAWAEPDTGHTASHWLCPQWTRHIVEHVPLSPRTIQCKDGWHHVTPMMGWY